MTTPCWPGIRDSQAAEHEHRLHRDCGGDFNLQTGAGVGWGPMTHPHEIAYAALCIAPFVRHPGQGGHWRFGRRLFSAVTCSRLIAAGLAVIVGNELRLA